MGVGKSSVGRAVARRLNMRFMDSDWAIEQEAGKSIADIFRDEGEAAFREKERQFICGGHPAGGVVVSCGGGLPMAPGMAEELKQRGIVVCLFARVETILARTVGNQKRPLLNVEDPEVRVRRMLAEREPVYMRTGIGVSAEGRTILEVAANVVRVYRREAGRRGGK